MVNVRIGTRSERRRILNHSIGYNPLFLGFRLFVKDYKMSLGNDVTYYLGQTVNVHTKTTRNWSSITLLWSLFTWTLSPQSNLTLSGTIGFTIQ